jgi:hypothetical protein
MRLPSPDDDYTAFLPIGSGLSDKSKGELSIEGSASGFAYQHEIFARGLPYQTKIMRDDWLVEVWESDAETAEQATVLFRQRVNFGLNIVASEVVPGVLDVFIAYPAENEQIETTIINGVEIDPADAKNPLDLGYQSEFGITSEFTASPGVSGGEVAGVWRSLPYVMDIPEGAVLKIRHDGWRPAGQLQASTYQFSYKPGGSILDALYDEHGALMRAVPTVGGVLVTQSYAPYHAGRQMAVVDGGKNPSIDIDIFGRVWIMQRDDDGWNDYVSYDGGRSFGAPKLVWSKEFTMARATINDDGVRASIAPIGKDVYFRTHDAQSGPLSLIAITLEKKQDVALVWREGVWQIIGETGILATSPDGGFWNVREGATSPLQEVFV